MINLELFEGLLPQNLNCIIINGQYCVQATGLSLQHDKLVCQTISKTYHIVSKVAFVQDQNMIGSFMVHLG